MSVAPINGPVIYARSGSYSLVAFDKLMAPVVAGWARDTHELFWLAPSTPPPLTAVKVVGWAGPQGGPRLLRRDGLVEPLGYCELNPMPSQLDHYWLGHCVIRPEFRGAGLGCLMVDLLLAEAFEFRRARRVSLIVFPENVVACRCYQSVGLSEVGDQYKYFATTGQRYRMLHMSISRSDFEARQRRRTASSAGPAPRGV